MLTNRLGDITNKEYSEKLLKIMTDHPGAIDEVWFSTEYGFPPLSAHEEAAKCICDSMEAYKKIGVRISLQLSNSIGHGFYMSSRNNTGLLYEGSKVEHMMDADGTVAEYCFCWWGENFRKYTFDAIKKYAAVKPYAVWIDDDLRPRNHAPVQNACFCDNCIAKFNKRYGTDFTRETLVHEINFGDVVWRERYMDFVREGMYDFTYALCSAICEVMPDVYIGLQQTEYYNYIEGGANCIYKAIYDATGREPLSRPGGGAYDDHNPLDFTEKGIKMLKQFRELPSYVKEIRPEIENLPHVAFGKSIPGLMFETSYYFAIGATAMSYSMMMHLREDVSMYGKMLDGFVAHKDYWKKLSEINKKTSPYGLILAYPKNGNSVVCEKPFEYINGENEDKETEWGYVNVPLVYERRNDGIFAISGEMISRMSDEEIEHLLSQPLVTDGEAIIALEKRGFDLGVKSTEVMTNSMREVFTDHEVNRGYEGTAWNGKFLEYRAWSLTGDNMEVLGRFEKTVPGDVVGDGTAANVIITTPKGAKWAVFGYDAWNRTISTAKREQIFNAMEYISEKPLDVRMISAFSAMVHPRMYENGEIASISLTNCTLGRYEDVQIRVNKAPGTKAELWGQYDEPIELTVDENSVITIPKSDGWTVSTIFFK